MSNASTVAHYIELACREAGKPLNGECRYELQSALEGMVEEAVGTALRELRTVEDVKPITIPAKDAELIDRALRTVAGKES